MAKIGKLYSPEFKEEALRLVHASDERYPEGTTASGRLLSTQSAE